MIAAQEELIDPAATFSAEWQAANDADARGIDIIMI
jgi:hypothetical protein